jgi:hypothetical protein
LNSAKVTATGCPSGPVPDSPPFGGGSDARKARLWWSLRLEGRRIDFEDCWTMLRAADRSWGWNAGGIRRRKGGCMRLPLEVAYLPNKIDDSRDCDCRFPKAQERTLKLKHAGVHFRRTWFLCRPERRGGPNSAPGPCSAPCRFNGCGMFPRARLLKFPSPPFPSVVHGGAPSPPRPPWVRAAFT